MTVTVSTDTVTLTLSGRVLRDLYNLVKPFASTDSTQPDLCSMWLRSDGKGNVFALATDRYRAIVSEVVVASLDTTEQFSMCIPMSTLKTITNSVGKLDYVALTLVPDMGTVHASNNKIDMSFEYKPVHFLDQTIVKMFINAHTSIDPQAIPRTVYGNQLGFFPKNDPVAMYDAGKLLVFMGENYTAMMMAPQHWTKSDFGNVGEWDNTFIKLLKD